MSDQELLALARKTLESGDANHLVRLVDRLVRERLAETDWRQPTANERKNEEARRARQPEPEPIQHGYRTLAHPTATRLRGILAVDNEPLYDRITIREGYEHAFFQTVIGWQGPGDAKVKTRADTNQWYVPSRLPEPEQFEVTGVSLVVREDAEPAFVTWLRHETFFEIVVGGMTTMDREPTSVVVRRTSTEAALETDLYLARPVLVYPKDTTIVISQMENFHARLTSPEPWTGKPEKVRCILHGFHGKGVSAR